MTNWLPVDMAKFNPPREKNIRGVRVTVFLSPYDVPSALRGYYDAAIKRFVIEFRYIAEEPLAVVPSGEPFKMYAGKNSGRLYRIEIDVDSIRAQSIQLRLEIPRLFQKALQRLESKRSDRKEYYDAVNRVLTDSLQQMPI